MTLDHLCEGETLVTWARLGAARTQVLITSTPIAGQDAAMRHHTQQELIVSQLQHSVASSSVDATAIRGPVETAERFQERQRDVIIASLALRGRVRACSRSSLARIALRFSR